MAGDDGEEKGENPFLGGDFLWESCGKHSLVDEYNRFAKWAGEVAQGQGACHQS